MSNWTSLRSRVLAGYEKARDKHGESVRGGEESVTAYATADTLKTVLAWMDETEGSSPQEADWATAKVPPYQHLRGADHKHGLHQSVRAHEHSGGAVPHTHDPQGDGQVPLTVLLPQQVEITYRHGWPEYRTKSGRLLSEDEVRGLAAEAEQGYEVVKPSTVARIAQLFASLYDADALDLTALPYQKHDETTGQWVERWLRS